MIDGDFVYSCWIFVVFWLLGKYRAVVYRQYAPMGWVQTGFNSRQPDILRQAQDKLKSALFSGFSRDWIFLFHQLDAFYARFNPSRFAGSGMPLKIGLFF